MSSTFDVTLHDMAHGGEAVGRLDDGRAVFVAGAVPGERVRIELVEEKKRYARARLLEVLEASPDRVEPPCPYVGDCGGCQWQHIAIERQRMLKREIVRGQLAHLARIADAPVEATRVVGSADGFGYRNHVVLSVDAEGRTGYYRPGSRDVVAVASCLVLHPLLREWQEQLPPLHGVNRLEMRAGTRTAQRLAMTRGRPVPETLRAAAELGIPLVAAGEDEITEMVHTEKMRVSSKSFFQVNTDGAEALVELVLEMLAPADTDTVIDAYAGVGLFTVPLARRAARVLAVERHPAAVRDLRHHAEQVRGKVHVIATDLERSFDQLPKRAELIVADPPREGLGEEAARALAGLRPHRFVLVACDAASFARDVASLHEAGYRLERAVPVDQFPHTFHVEIVALLVPSTST